MKRFGPSIGIFLLTVPGRYFFCGSFVSFVSCISHAFASVHCCPVATGWEKADLLALVCDVDCIFVAFPCGILGQVWYLIGSFPDLCPFFITLLFQDFVCDAIQKHLIHFPWILGSTDSHDIPLNASVIEVVFKNNAWILILFLKL